MAHTENTRCRSALRQVQTSGIQSTGETQRGGGGEESFAERI